MIGKNSNFTKMIMKSLDHEVCWGPHLSPPSVTLEDKPGSFGDWSARNGGETWKAASEGGVPLRVCILNSQSVSVVPQSRGLRGRVVYVLSGTQKKPNKKTLRWGAEVERGECIQRRGRMKKK